MMEAKPLNSKIVTKPFMVLLVFIAIAGVLLIKRFLFGIGSVSNMSDGYPWGIWIAYDVVVGTAIACGGYSLALIVYVLNKGEYHPLVRPALLASLLGYTLAGFSIFFDVGRYWQGYNLFWIGKYSQFNSVMFEVGFCITLYIFVLWVEFSPVFAEGAKAYGLKKSLKKLMFVFIAFGILLPTMHQSSLGSLLLVAGRKLSPLWQTGLIPLLFLLSAIAMGYAIVIFESISSSLAFKRSIETPLLTKLSTFISPLLFLYLLIRFGDLIFRGHVGLAFSLDLKGNMFLLENLLYLIPAVLLASAQNRKSAQKLFISAFCVLAAGALYRFNAFLIGFNPGAGWNYFPSVPEIMITLGVVSIEIAAYLIIVKKLPVLPAIRHAQ